MTRTISLDFIVRGGAVYPVDDHLNQLASQFAEKELAEKVNLSDYRKVLVVCEVDDSGKPQKVVGIAFGNPIFDWPGMRFVTQEAGDSLISRMRGYLEDQGFRGWDTFIHIEDHKPAETYCPQWKDFLRQQKAEKASRWKVRV